MQHNLRLIQLLLNLHNAIRLLRILVLDNIILQFREAERRVRVGEGGARVRGEEFVDYFGEQLVGDERGVVLAADYDAADSFGAGVGVEGVVCEGEGVR